MIKVLKCSASLHMDCVVVAGDGTNGNSANKLEFPFSTATDASGNYIVADRDNGRVQKCPAGGSGTCTTVVDNSNNIMTGAGLFKSNWVGVDPDGNYIVHSWYTYEFFECPPDCLAITQGCRYR